MFAARDTTEGSARLAGLLDLDPPFRDAGVAEFGLDNAVFVFGDQFVEIVSPLRNGAAASRLLGRRGDCGYMLILQTDDLARERARRQVGCAHRFRSRPDIGAVHLHPKDIGGAIVFVDERPAPSWRWGRPGWRLQPGSRGEQRVVGVTVEAQDPCAMAVRWAQGARPGSASDRRAERDGG